MIIGLIVKQTNLQNSKTVKICHVDRIIVNGWLLDPGSKLQGTYIVEPSCW